MIGPDWIIQGTKTTHEASLQTVGTSQKNVLQKKV